MQMLLTEILSSRYDTSLLRVASSACNPVPLSWDEANSQQEFQKEAALRQMNEYKRAKRTIEKEYDELQKKAAAHDEHIRAIDTWFSQVSRYAFGYPIVC